MSTPIPRPTWLKIAALLAAAGAVAWPVLAMLGILGVIPAQTVLSVGVLTAVLAYISIRRIKHDRAIVTGATDPVDGSQPPADDSH